jgi:hypothetical protein
MGRIELLPNAEVDTAKTDLNRQFTADEVKVLIAGGTAAAAVVVSGEIAAGLGGAAIMQGLAAVGGSAVGDILVVASGPALASYGFVNAACNASENDETTKDAVNVACASGTCTFNTYA